MYYINNKKVKEMLKKGSDGFLHRVSYGYLGGNKKFYGQDSSFESPLVDVHVYYEGERINTLPQFIKRSELSTTTITVQQTFSNNLKVSSPNSSGVINFSGSKGSRPTFKLNPSIIGSKTNINIYLLKAPDASSDWIDTNCYSIELSDYSFSSIPTSAFYKDGGFENAAVYARDGSLLYGIYNITGIAVLPAPNHESFGYVSLELTDLPDVSGAYSDSLSFIHFGYLPKSTAEAMGFTAEENPNGIEKTSIDYYGWGCWADNRQWLWSDDELREIFSSDGSTIRQAFLDDVINASTLTYGDVWHWGIYDLSVNNLGGTASFENNPVFQDGWIFDHDDVDILSDIHSLQNSTLSEVLNNYFSNPQGTVTMILPYSQPTLESNNTMGGLIGELMNSSVLESDIYTDAQQLFNTNRQFPENNIVDGILQTSVGTGGYLYCCNKFGNSDVIVATELNSITLSMESETSIVYLGTRNKNSTLSLSFSNPTSGLTDMFNSERLNYFKILPFITGQNDGAISTDGTIELTINS